MAYSYHPHPIVGATKVFIIAAILTVLLLFSGILLGGLSFILLLVVWAISILQMAVLFVRAHYQTITLDENAITYTAGIISRQRVVLPHQRISEASYNQGLVQRIFGVGTLTIDTAGGAHMAVRLADVRKNDLMKTLREINKKGGREEPK